MRLRVLGLVFAGSVLAAGVTHQVQAAPTGTQYYSCSETDDGNDSSVFGSLTYTSNETTAQAESTLVDQCLGNTTLSEVYCSGTTPVSATVTCAQGCSAGACVNVAVPSCTDSDAGANSVFYKGTAQGVTIAGTTGGTDYCVSSNTLREYSCSSGASTVQDVTCEHGCADGACRTSLRSEFFRNDQNAKPVILGTPYYMLIPNFVVQGNFNRDTFAYKILSALHMLGYDTGIYSASGNVAASALNRFQQRNGFPVGDTLSPQALQRMDDLLLAREPEIETVARRFPFYPDHVGALHDNDPSQAWLAYIYQTALEALPSYMQPDLFTLLRCTGQCVGSFIYADGRPYPYLSPGGALPRRPLPTDTDYYYRSNYFSRFREQGQLVHPAAAMVQGLLHEYGHWIDIQWESETSTDPDRPLRGILDTRPYNAISWNILNRAPDPVDPNRIRYTCVERKSNDRQDFISWYGGGFGAAYCAPDYPVGYGGFTEDFAEAFADYVTAGRSFRAATLRNPVIAQKYNWLKDNIFEGREYDTDLSQRDNGCNGNAATNTGVPGYVSCSYDYVWDGKLPLLQN